MQTNRKPMNILVTLDRNYIPYLNVMLSSLINCDSEEYYHVYLMHNSLERCDVEITNRILGENGQLHLIRITEEQLGDAPTTDRYPHEIYYRIFAAKYLPTALDRVLYLDPDIIVNKSLRSLYDLDMGNNYFAAASHIGEFLHFINELRLDMDEAGPYINSGVMLINLEKLRAEQSYEEVFDYIREHHGKLILPDQDIISGLYGSKIIPLDPYCYNMTERLLAFQHTLPENRISLEYVRENAAIIHYCGRNKPWKSGYIGKLNVFYEEAAAMMPKIDLKYPLSDKMIVDIAKEQSAIDLGCDASDFDRTENVIVKSVEAPMARKYLTLPFVCNLVTYGGNIVASIGDEQYRGIVYGYIGRYEGCHCFETPNMHVLNDAFEKHGMRVCFMAEYFLPETSRLYSLDCPYELRILEKNELDDLYKPEWSNALCEKRRELDVLGIGAFDDDGKLIGLAGCSADCEKMWQIGVDVLPDHRKHGAAAALTSRLAIEILKRGHVPFYCCAWSNIASARNAIKCGFRPAWVEMTVKPSEFVDEMNA